MTDGLFEVSDEDKRPASAEFKLSITRALADQLAVQLGKLRRTLLSAEQLALLEDRPGVYELYLNGNRVYVGKTSKSLPERLGNHLRKLSGRTRIKIENVGFICLYVDEDLEAAAPEKLLIKKYRGTGGAPWNTMGFGNKDPGRNRDNSLVKAKHFDAEYPIDLDRVVEDLTVGDQPANDLLKEVKAKLPYNLRFETKNKIKSELRAARITVTSSTLAMREIMRLTIEALPEGWQATALQGYAILYHETHEYKSAQAFWRKQSGHAREFAGEGLLDQEGEVEQEDDEGESP